MRDAPVFISHSNADAGIALGLALALEKAGYGTWVYEVDRLPGVSYLLHTGKGVEQCEALLLLVSPQSIHSHQITSELVRAKESRKHLVPVLHVLWKQVVSLPERRYSGGPLTRWRFFALSLLLDGPAHAGQQPHIVGEHGPGHGQLSIGEAFVTRRVSQDGVLEDADARLGLRPAFLTGGKELVFFQTPGQLMRITTTERVEDVFLVE